MAAGNFTPYKSLIHRLARQEVDFLKDTIQAALLDNAHTPSAVNHAVWADVSGDECGDGDYAAQTLGGKTIARDGSDRTVFDANDVPSVNGFRCLGSQCQVCLDRIGQRDQ
jgi:hypothetical protein